MKTFYYSNLVNKVEEIQSTFYNNDSKYGWKTYKKMCIQKERNMLKFSPSIIPERYLWHLSYPCFRESILTNGIIPNYEEHHVLFVNARLTAIVSSVPEIAPVKNSWPLILSPVFLTYVCSKLEFGFTCSLPEPNFEST